MYRQDEELLNIVEQTEILFLKTLRANNFTAHNCFK
jgi:hypothetical protein